MADEWEVVQADDGPVIRRKSHAAARGFEKADPLSDPASGQGANAKPGLSDYLPLPVPFDSEWIMECARQYDELGDELYELPWWVWLRRRRALAWRKHYAERIADEFEAWRHNVMGSTASVVEHGFIKAADAVDSQEAENQRLRDALKRLVEANDENEAAICDLISAFPPDGAEARQVVAAAELVEAFKAARAALAEEADRD